MTPIRASLAATAIAALLQSSGGAAVAGMAIDATGRPLPATVVVLFDPAAKREYVTTTDAAGVFRLDAVATGKYMVVATRAGYISAEYGAPWPGDAGWPVDIGASGRSDLTLTLRKGGAISGTVTDENGDPLTAVVIARHLVKGTQKLGRSDSHGQYRIANLLPGPYLISAGAIDGQSLSGGSDQRLIRAPTFYNGAADAAQATLVIIAGEPEISGIDLQLRAVPMTTTSVASQTEFMNGYFYTDIGLFEVQPQPGRSTVAVAGRIVFEGASRRDFIEPILLAIPDRSTGSLLIQTPRPLRSLMAAQIPGQSLERFTMKPYAGTYVLGWQPRSAPWSVKAVTSGGRDILDLPITLSPNAPIDDVVATFTDKATELSGFLVASDGAPILGAMAMIFPTDTRYWYSGSRRVQMVLGDGTGRYMLSGLPPGEYRTLLVTPEILASTHRLGLSEVLTRFSAGSGTFTLSEGERKNVDIPGRRSGIVR